MTTECLFPALDSDQIALELIGNPEFFSQFLMETLPTIDFSPIRHFDDNEDFDDSFVVNPGPFQLNTQERFDEFMRAYAGTNNDTDDEAFTLYCDETSLPETPPRNWTGKTRNGDNGVLQYEIRVEEETFDMKTERKTNQPVFIDLVELERQEQARVDQVYNIAKTVHSGGVPPTPRLVHPREIFVRTIPMSIRRELDFAGAGPKMLATGQRRSGTKRKADFPALVTILDD